MEKFIHSGSFGEVDKWKDSSLLFTTKRLIWEVTFKERLPIILKLFGHKILISSNCHICHLKHTLQKIVCFENFHGVGTYLIFQLTLCHLTKLGNTPKNENFNRESFTRVLSPIRGHTAYRKVIFTYTYNTYLLSFENILFKLDQMLFTSPSWYRE